MTVAGLDGAVEPVDTIVCVKIQQESFQLRDFAVLRDVDLGQSVNRSHSILHRCQLLRGHRIAFVDHEDVRVRYLRMRGRHMGAVVLVIRIICDGLIETQKDILRVNQSHDAVEVDAASETIVNPEQRSQVPGIGETAGFEDDVVETAAAGDERFNGCHARVSSRQDQNRDRERTSHGRSSGSYLMEQHMQPLANSSHSSTCWPSWLIVKDFSMSAAGH